MFGIRNTINNIDGVINSAAAYIRKITVLWSCWITGVEAFKSDVVSETILMRLLKQDVIFHIKMKDKERFKSDPACVIYQQGKPVDYFVLILEGRVEVTVGRENLVFESGPFTYFGSQALHQNIGIGKFRARMTGKIA